MNLLFKYIIYHYIMKHKPHHKVNCPSPFEVFVITLLKQKNKALPQGLCTFQSLHSIVIVIFFDMSQLKRMAWQH
jgi:hypothetical protein